MKYHKYVMSGEEVSCPECDKKYPQNFLKRHMKSAHENSQLDELDGNYLILNKEGCNRGHGLSAAIKLGTQEPGFFHFGPRLTWIL